MVSIVTLEEAAARLNKSLPTIRAWIAKGGDAFVIERGGLGKPWKLDLDRLTAWRDEQIRKGNLKGSKRVSRAMPTTRTGNAYVKDVRLTQNGDDLQPICEAYRNRQDLGDDPFVRGVFYGLHRLGFNMAEYAADCAIEAGASGKVAYALMGRMREAVCGIIWEVGAYDLSLIRKPDDGHAGEDIPAHLAPAFFDYAPSDLARQAGEPLDLHEWALWQSEVEEQANRR